MGKPSRDHIVKLEDLPNIGKAMAGDLRRIGIENPFQLIGKNPFEMYENLSAITGKRQDPCVLDVFMSVVHFMEKGESLPWWRFTETRKRLTLERKNESTT